MVFVCNVCLSAAAAAAFKKKAPPKKAERELELEKEESYEGLSDAGKKLKKIKSRHSGGSKKPSVNSNGPL